jgi:hypothetical protein
MKRCAEWNGSRWSSSASFKSRKSIHMHFGARLFTAFGVVALVMGGVANSGVTAAAETDSVGHVYVNDNTAGATRWPASTATPTVR